MGRDDITQMGFLQEIIYVINIGFYFGDLWLWLALTKISIVASNLDFNLLSSLKFMSRARAYSIIL